MNSTKQKRKYRFLITAGGTREYIDPVRFISNASSGRTGYALARAALKAGYKVILISTIKELPSPKGARVVYVESCAEMFSAVKRHFSWCDCLVMAAAVADYTPVKKSVSKIKKTSTVLNLKLKPTTDILKWAGQHKKKGQRVVGFALGDRNLRALAEEKLKAKKLDMIVANSPAAVGAQKVTVWIKIPGRQWLKTGPATKRVIADKIIRLIERLGARA